MSIHEMIDPASNNNPLWNLLEIAEDLVSSIAKFCLVFTVGFIGFHLTVRIIRSLISKLYKMYRRRNPEDPEVIWERIRPHFELLMQQRPFEEIEQFLDLLVEIAELPEELFRERYNRGVQNVTLTAQ
ncbi:uncharacterized protein LOC135836972 isoform X2 [Planococcus citri]|uniref:uncharacterized protein LOC135836972 isoform X2 n=1 Tax=Planococcus citri TaxID=170843 RepID=UPI0031FA1BA9